MSKVLMYTKDHCPYCVSAKRLLGSKNISFEEINMENRLDELMQLKEKYGWKTVPMIFINDKLIGGYTDLAALNEKGELDLLLSK